MERDLRRRRRRDHRRLCFAWQRAQRGRRDGPGGRAAGGVRSRAAVGAVRVRGAIHENRPLLASDAGRRRGSHRKRDVRCHRLAACLLFTGLGPRETRGRRRHTSHASTEPCAVRALRTVVREPSFAESAQHGHRAAARLRPPRLHRHRPTRDRVGGLAGGAQAERWRLRRGLERAEVVGRAGGVRRPNLWTHAVLLWQPWACVHRWHRQPAGWSHGGTNGRDPSVRSGLHCAFDTIKDSIEA
mmetsp:Transcript_177855/g.570448  ORF Transcript_177855/g.570448 Transcript_177855/m.570448 type:complete len:243 (+) Transcript_177855:483-1211(+)